MIARKKKKAKKAPVKSDEEEASSTTTGASSYRTAYSCDTFEMLNKPFSGQLLKYTNVMKGWQYRWFVLDPFTGMLHYYLSSTDVKMNARGGVCLRGAIISPSDEDSNMFTIHSIPGQVFKVKSSNARERQEWIDRLRFIAEHHSNANISKVIPERKPMDVTAHSGVFVHGSNIHCSATIESFKSAKQHLKSAEQKYLNVIKVIEALPLQGTFVSVDPRLLMLKACSSSLINSLSKCADILQSTFAADCGFQQPSTSKTSTLSSNLIKRPSFIFAKNKK